MIWITSVMKKTMFTWLNKTMDWMKMSMIKKMQIMKRKMAKT